MAQGIGNFIDRIQLGTDEANQIAIGSSAYGVCNTGASEAAKTVNIPGFALKTGTTIHIKFNNVNSADSPTLNVSNTGAKAIMQYGTTNAGIAEETSGWRAGAVLTLTYDGTNWIRDQGYNTNKTYSTLTQALVNTGTETTGKLVTAKIIKDTVTNAINDLDVADISGFGAGKTLATLTETDGKIAATFQNISITKSQISDFPSTMTPASHTHGNLQNNGTLQTNDITIADGDKLIVTDASDSNKVARTSISFDGSTTSKVLSQKGTWVNMYSHPTSDGNKHVPATGTTNGGKFLKAGDTAGSFAWASITKADITDFPTTMTPASHKHGNINNDGTITDATSTGIATDANNKIIAVDLSATTPAASGNATSFITSITQDARGKLTTISKATIPTADASTAGIMKLGASGGAATYGHTHGNITSGGALQTADITIADGDKLIVTDASNSNKIARTSISFDGSTTTKALTQKGTWETFNNYSLPLAADGTRGGVQIGYSANGKNYPVELDNEKMYVNVPWTDHYAWNDITGKPTTVSGYGITDALPLAGGIMTGNIRRYYGTASTEPMITMLSNNLDTILWEAGHGSSAAATTTSNHYKLLYKGTGSDSDNSNYLQLIAHKTSDLIAVQIDEVGNVSLPQMDKGSATKPIYLNNGVITEGTQIGASAYHADSYFAVANHGNHVPETQTANNITFLRNDNSWFKLTKAEVNTLINLLDTGSSDLTANDYIITQYVGGGTTTTTYHRRPASKVVNATLVKAALGTNSTHGNAFLRKDGTWQTPPYPVTSVNGYTGAVSLTASDLGLSNALHFIGITSTTLADGDTTATLTAKSTNSLSKTTGFVDGDVVMDGDQLREYVWAASAWHLLGFTTSTAYSQTATGNSWITSITQGTDGRITATTGTLDTSGTWSGTATKATTTADTTNTLYVVGVTSSATSTLKRDTSITIKGGTLTATTFNGVNLSLSKYMNTIITGSGTAAVTSGTKMPALWKFDLAIASPNEGDIITIKIPVAGHSNGVFISLDNGTTYYPVSVNNTSALTTHYSANQIITLVCVGSGSTNSIYPAQTTINGNTYTLGTSANITGKHWCVVNYYDSGNTNTLQRTFRSTTNVELPIAGINASNSATATYVSDSSIASGSYASMYAAIPNDTTKLATINPSTGHITIPGGITTSALHVGTADSYGDAYTPIYWNDGVPATVTPIQYCAFTIGSGKKGVKLTHAAFTATSYVMQIVVTSGESNLNSTIAWESAAGYINLTCSATSGAVNGYILVSRGDAVTATPTDIT